MQTLVHIIENFKEEGLVCALIAYYHPSIKLEHLLISKTVHYALGAVVINRRFQMLRCMALNGRLPFAFGYQEVADLKKFYLVNHFCADLDRVLCFSNLVSSELINLAIQNRYLCCLKNMIERQRGCKKFKSLRRVAHSACKHGDQDLLAIFLNNGGRIEPELYAIAVESNQNDLLDTLLGLIPYSGKICLWNLLDSSRPKDCIQILNSDIKDRFNDAYNATEKVLSRHQVHCCCHLKKSKISLY